MTGFQKEWDLYDVWSNNNAEYTLMLRHVGDNMEVTIDHRHIFVNGRDVHQSIPKISFNLWNVLSFDRFGNILMV